MNYNQLIAFIRSRSVKESEDFMAYVLKETPSYKLVSSEQANDIY